MATKPTNKAASAKPGSKRAANAAARLAATGVTKKSAAKHGPRTSSPVAIITGGGTGVGPAAARAVAGPCAGLASHLPNSATNPRTNRGVREFCMRKNSSCQAVDA